MENIEEFEKLKEQTIEQLKEIEGRIHLESKTCFKAIKMMEEELLFKPIVTTLVCEIVKGTKFEIQAFSLLKRYDKIEIYFGEKKLTTVNSIDSYKTNKIHILKALDKVLNEKNDEQENNINTDDYEQFGFLKTMPNKTSSNIEFTNKKVIKKPNEIVEDIFNLLKNKFIPIHDKAKVIQIDSIKNENLLTVLFGSFTACYYVNAKMDNGIVYFVLHYAPARDKGYSDVSIVTTKDILNLFDEKDVEPYKNLLNDLKIALSNEIYTKTVNDTDTDTALSDTQKQQVDIQNRDNHNNQKLVILNKQRLLYTITNELIGKEIIFDNKTHTVLSTYLENDDVIIVTKSDNEKSEKYKFYLSYSNSKNNDNIQLYFSAGKNELTCSVITHMPFIGRILDVNSVLKEMIRYNMF